MYSEKALIRNKIFMVEEEIENSEAKKEIAKVFICAGVVALVHGFVTSNSKTFVIGFLGSTVAATAFSKKLAETKKMKIREKQLLKQL